MATLTSRPAPPPAAPSTDELMDAVTPAVNVLTWLTRSLFLKNDGSAATRDAYGKIEEVLDCFDFPGYVIMVAPGGYPDVVYDVAIKPIFGGSYVSFKVIFKVVP